MGVSLDDIESHAKFAEKYSLPFSILADSDKSTAKAYGVYAKIGSFEMAKRQSFIIDPRGQHCQALRQGQCSIPLHPSARRPKITTGNLSAQFIQNAERRCEYTAVFFAQGFTIRALNA